MPAKDDFDPGQDLPRFLVAHAEQDNAPDEATAPSRASKARILIITAAAAGIAVLAIGNPEGLFTQVSALLAGHSTPQSAPIQTAADAPALIAAAAADAQDLPQDSPPAANGAPARAEIAAEPIAEDPAEKSEASSETLFSQFQAWAATQDAQKPGAAAEPALDAPASIMQNVEENVPAPAAKNVRARSRTAQKRQPVRTAVRNARAEVRTQNLQRQIPQAARAARAPAQDPRAQDAAAQDAQTAPFLGIFGQRN